MFQLIKLLIIILNTFKNIPHSIFPGIAPENMRQNVLVLQIFPTEGITLSLQAKKPGPKLCVGAMQLNFDYASLGKNSGDDAYQTDCDSFRGGKSEHQHQHGYEYYPSTESEQGAQHPCSGACGKESDDHQWVHIVPRFVLQIYDGRCSLYVCCILCPSQ